MNDEKHTYGPTSISQLPLKGRGPFYGWIIVGIGFITQFFQGIANQGYGSYFPFLQRQFGWSSAMLAAPRSVTQVNNSVLGPVEGFLVDKFGPRFMATIGVFVMGLGLILFGLTNSLWMYFLANVVIAAGTGFQGLLVMSVAINNWFRRKRTIAQAIMLLGFSTAGLIGVPAIGLVQTSAGWQTSAIASGVFIWVIGLPCAQLLRTKPEPYGLVPDGAPAISGVASNARRHEGAEYDFTLRQAIHTRSFWLLAMSWAVGNMAMGVAQMFLYLHLEDGEASLSHAAVLTVWSVASFSNIPFRLIGGFLGDRLPKNVLLGGATMLMAASVYVLAIATSLEMAFAFAVIYGIGWGVRTPVMNALQADYFGRRSLGKIVGWLQSLSLPLTIAAPIVVGHVADVQGTYRMAFIVTSFISLIGGTMLFLATAPKAPVAKHTSSSAMG